MERMTSGKSQAEPQTGRINAVTKNGNQQTTKAPVMITRVLAAFLSLLDSMDSRDEIMAFTLSVEDETILLLARFAVSVVAAPAVVATDP